MMGMASVITLNRCSLSRRLRSSSLITSLDDAAALSRLPAALVVESVFLCLRTPEELTCSSQFVFRVMTRLPCAELIGCCEPAALLLSLQLRPDSAVMTTSPEARPQRLKAWLLCTPASNAELYRARQPEFHNGLVPAVPQQRGTLVRRAGSSRFFLDIRGFAPRSCDLFHSLAEFAFEAFHCRLVVATIAEVVRKTLHIRDFGFQVVGILIALAVAEGFHETGWRIAQMKRNRISGGL